MKRMLVHSQHGCCWFQAEATFFASQKTRRADFDTEVKICTALGIAAIAFLLLDIFDVVVAVGFNISFIMTRYASLNPPHE